VAVAFSAKSGDAAEEQDAAARSVADDEEEGVVGDERARHRRALGRHDHGGRGGGLGALLVDLDERGTVSGSLVRCRSGPGNVARSLPSDGNLVIYDAQGTPRWSSNTWGQSGAVLLMQTDGNLVIYGAGGALWASHTCCR
jgi:hypothetical protein